MGITAALLGFARPQAWVYAQDAAPVTKTNLELFRKLAAELASDSIIPALRADTSGIRVRVVPPESAWLVEDDIVGALRRGGARIAQRGGGYEAEFGLVRLQVLYENVRRDGMFGPKLVDRAILVALHARVKDLRDSQILNSGDVSRQYRDTVEVAEIEHLESSMVPATRGVLPSEGLFTNLAEPLIMLGAVAVAVVLLFTVRS